MEPRTDRTLPSDVTDFLLTECRNRGDVLTNLKLQKLLYYSQAWFLALYNEPLFTEDFQAWVQGPILPSQYKRFAKFEWRPITDDVFAPDLVNGRAYSHLMQIVDIFGSENAIALGLMACHENPWREARRGIPRDEQSEDVITKESMRSFYAFRKAKNTSHLIRNTFEVPCNPPPECQS